MSRVELAPELGDDFDRILDHLAQHEIENAKARIGEIIHAFDVLESNPLIGRLALRDTRELIIGRGSRGYVALYRNVQEVCGVSTRPGTSATDRNSQLRRSPCGDSNPRSGRSVDSASPTFGAQ